MQAVASPPVRCDTTVQAVSPSLARAVGSADPVPALTPYHGPAVQVVTPLGEPNGPLQLLLRQIQGEQYVTVMDDFCLDNDHLALERKERTPSRP